MIDEPAALDQVPVRVTPDGNGRRYRGGGGDVVVADLHVIDVEEADPGVPDLEGIREDRVPELISSGPCRVLAVPGMDADVEAIDCAILQRDAVGPIEQEGDHGGGIDRLVEGGGRVVRDAGLQTASEHCFRLWGMKPTVLG
jgi:hypothetical protein